MHALLTESEGSRSSRLYMHYLPFQMILVLIVAAISALLLMEGQNARVLQERFSLWTEKVARVSRYELKLSAILSRGNDPRSSRLYRHYLPFQMILVLIVAAILALPLMEWQNARVLQEKYFLWTMEKPALVS